MFDVLHVVVPLFIIIISLCVFISIIVIISKSVKANKNKKQNINFDQNKETEENFADVETSQQKLTEGQKWKQTGEEISAKLRHLFREKFGLGEEKQYTKNETANKDDDKLKTNKCKNCGAQLELDKAGRKKCPYCKSKYF